LLVIGCAVSSSGAEAQRDGLAEYERGDFEAAAELFAARASEVPLDWRARSDLSIVALQRDRVETAMAQAGAAFVLHPSDADLRWNLALAARRLGWVDPRLRGLAFGNGVDAMARLANVASWQTLAVVAAFAFWLALGGVFWARHAGRRVRAPAITAGLALAAALVAVGMVDRYGLLADRGAGIVAEPATLRSLPTDALDEQVEVELEAGRVVVVQHAFLGWAHVRLANDDRGWVRADKLDLIYERWPAPGEPLPWQPRVDPSVFGPPRGAPLDATDPPRPGAPPSQGGGLGVPVGPGMENEDRSGRNREGRVL